MSSAQNDKSRQVTFIFLSILGIGLLYLLQPILMPFLAGILLAYLCDPIVDRLMKLRISRLAAVIIVFLVLFLGVVLFVFLLTPIIQQQVLALSVVISNTFVWLQTKAIPKLVEHMGAQQYTEEINILKTTFSETLSKASGMVGWFLKTLLQSGKAVFEALMNLVLIPVVTFYFMRDWDLIMKNIRSIIPKKIRPTVIKLTRECDAMLSGFFRGQLLVMISLGVYYAIGLSIIGLPVGVLIGFIIGIVSIVPYLGFFVGISIAIIAVLVQYGTLTSIVSVLVVFAIGQLLESTILTPKLIGDRIGLHPVAVIFAILAGGVLFGFFGILLALPVAAIIMVLLRHAYEQHKNVFQSA